MGRTSQQRCRSRIMLMTKFSSSLVTLLCLPVLGTYPEWIYIAGAETPGNGWFQLFRKNVSGDNRASLTYAKHPSQRSNNDLSLWKEGGLPRWYISYERFDPEDRVPWDAALLTEYTISDIYRSKAASNQEIPVCGWSELCEAIGPRFCDIFVPCDLRIWTEAMLREEALRSWFAGIGIPAIDGAGWLADLPGSMVFKFDVDGLRALEGLTGLRTPKCDTEPHQEE